MKIFNLFFAAVFSIPSIAFAMTPLDIVKTIESNLAPKNFTGTYEFTNTRSDGTTTQYVIEFQNRDIDHSHGVFKKPELEKGREVLRVDDALWSWIPSVGKAVRILDRDSFAGGDFSNADILRVDWSAQYSPKLAKETEKQWILDLEAKNKDAAYGKMRIWVDKGKTQPVQQHYFDSRGTLLKKCLYGSVTQFGEVTRPARLVMENIITKQKSELKILQLKLGVTIPESRFSVDRLGK